jgi:hypothetical protein
MIYISLILKSVWKIIEWLPDDFARPKCEFQELVDERSNLFPQAWKVNNCWFDNKSNQYSDVVLTVKRVINLIIVIQLFETIDYYC